MKACIVLSVALMTALVPIQTRAASVSRIAGKSVTLFQSSFKTKGIKKWMTASSSASGGVWKVSRKGVLSFDGTAISEATPPVSTAHVRDFRVEARIKVAGPIGKDDTGFGLMVHRSSTTFGVLGAIAYFTGGSDGNQPQLFSDAYSVGGKSFTVQPGYHDYRLDVHGIDYTFLIDGQEVVQFPIAGAAGNKISIWSSRTSLQIKSLTVTKLPTAPPLPAAPALQSIDLTSQDAPASFSGLDYHFLTPDEIAQPGITLPLSRLNNDNFILGHTAFVQVPSQPTTGPIVLGSHVFTFGSPTGAQSYLASELSDDQTAPMQQNVTAMDLAGPGDQAHLLSFDLTDTTFTNSGFPATFVGVLFRRGSYEAAVFEEFVRGTISTADEVSQVKAFAVAIDTRIPASA